MTSLHDVLPGTQRTEGKMSLPLIHTLSSASNHSTPYPSPSPATAPATLARRTSLPHDTRCHRARSALQPGCCSLCVDTIAPATTLASTAMPCRLLSHHDLSHTRDEPIAGWRQRAGAGCRRWAGDITRTGKWPLICAPRPSQSSGHELSSPGHGRELSLAGRARLPLLLRAPVVRTATDILFELQRTSSHRSWLRWGRMGCPMASPEAREPPTITC